MTKNCRVNVGAILIARFFLSYIKLILLLKLIISDIINHIIETGEKMKSYEFILKNLDCANCANKIQNKLAENKELLDVIVNFNTLKLKYKTDTLSKNEVEAIIKKIEPEVTLVEVQKYEEKTSIKNDVLRLIIGILTANIGFLLPTKGIISSSFIIAGYMILLHRTIKNTVKLLKTSHLINENFLVTISCIGAYLIGEHFEGFMVIVLYEIGKILEEKAVNKTRKSIANLMDIKPEYANIKIADTIEKVQPQSVKIGDVLVIKQGEKIPLDGTVIKGKASLDVASLTGESKLKNVEEKDEVLSGSILIEGILEIEVTKTYEDSTVSKILELVEHATDKKAKTETFVNKMAKIYTPGVTIMAIAIAVFLPIVTNITYIGANGSIYRALVFLVVSCPCAIAISVPLSYFSGIGKASKNGILIKGSNYLDLMKDVGEIIFDKTGTLTKGEFSIQKIEVVDNNFNEDEVLKYVLLGEQFSNHPIAKSITKNREIPKENITDFTEIAGEGISYKLNENIIFVGSNKEEKDEETTICVKINDNIIGKIYLEDTVKFGAKEAIQVLKKMGIITKMFTGDSKNIALKIGKELKLDEVKYEMLPDDKYKELEKEISVSKKKIAFVGDGINDSPVLARADVGISMGGVGSSSAIEASDIVIMTDEIGKIGEAIKISKYTNKIIKQNLIFAIGIKVSLLALSTIGIASMWQAVFADVGVTVIAILNTLRILKFE